ncbi:hypothetical protein JRI60_16720 [Archangium violaceum]|uniref:MXAN_2561 family MXYO-CTERM-anchored protein n=1 Tax=Archangium violaceum TaxID=83451 RepID=UPI0019518A2B|nr:MXAN_2561 family MXYO-CTERM-anchored protein [Archangium violaceum]QRO00556.1 hypothetical protein JRI60_16720 [Archangium violaceum]
MRNLLLLTAVLLSSAASAQAVQLRLSTGQETRSFGPKTCTGVVAVTWTRTGTVCDQLSLWLTQPGKDCGDSPATGDVSLDAISRDTLLAQGTGNFQVDLSQLPFPITDGGGGCGSLAQDATFRLCGATKSPSGLYGETCNTVLRASGMKFVYDGTPPAAPVIEDAQGLDEALLADVSEPTGATVIELHVSRDGTEVTTVRQDVGRGAIRVEGLENEATYQLVAYAFDQAENQSAASEAKEATPTKTNGFMEEYVNAGGKETGGCGAAGGGVVGSAVLAALGFWLSSRRNRS